MPNIFLWSWLMTLFFHICVRTSNIIALLKYWTVSQKGFFSHHYLCRMNKWTFYNCSVRFGGFCFVRWNFNWEFQVQCMYLLFIFKECLINRRDLYWNETPCTACAQNILASFHYLWEQFFSTSQQLSLNFHIICIASELQLLQACLHNQSFKNKVFFFVDKHLSSHSLKIFTVLISSCQSGLILFCERPIIWLGWQFKAIREGFICAFLVSNDSQGLYFSSGFWRLAISTSLHLRKERRLESQKERSCCPQSLLQHFKTFFISDKSCEVSVRLSLKLPR